MSQFKTVLVLLGLLGSFHEAALGAGGMVLSPPLPTQEGAPPNPEIQISSQSLAAAAQQAELNAALEEQRRLQSESDLWKVRSEGKGCFRCFSKACLG